jgi:hypothetical protein
LIDIAMKKCSLKKLLARHPAIQPAGASVGLCPPLRVSEHVSVSAAASLAVCPTPMEN